MDIDQNSGISRITCQFDDRKLESEFRDFRWEKIRNYVRNLMIISECINMVIRADDIRLLGPNPWYIGYHILSFTLFLFFLFFLSDNNKKKWHQAFFTFTIIGFMNVGVLSYYFTGATFPVKAAVLPIIMILWFYVWPFLAINSMIVTLTTGIPFCFLVLYQGSMTPDQVPYLFVMPFIFFFWRNGLQIKTKELIMLKPRN